MHVYEVQARKDHRAESICTFRTSNAAKIETHEHNGDFGVTDYSELFAGCRPGLFNETRRKRLGRELVDRSVVILAPMNGGAVKISKLTDDHAVIGKRAIWRALERMNYSLGPLTAAGRA
jgi:hypothetical protein